MNSFEIEPSPKRTARLKILNRVLSDNMDEMGIKAAVKDIGELTAAIEGTPDERRGKSPSFFFFINDYIRFTF